MAFDLVARLKLVDNMTSPLRRATRELESMGGIAGGVGLSLSKLGGALAAVGAAAGGVAAIGSSMGKAMDFQAQIDAVASLDKSLDKTTENGKKNYKALQALALDLGQSTAFSALESAKGMEEMIKAGVSVERVLNGGAKAALDLAAAGGVEVAKAAETMAIAINSFSNDASLQGPNGAARAADILAGTANAAATGVDDLKLGMAQFGAVANNLRMPLLDAASAIGIMTNSGQSAADAGTTLKTMFNNLSPSVAGNIKMFRDLGFITKKNENLFYKANGEVKDLASVAQLLQDKLKGLNPKQQGDIMKQIFGDDGMKAGLILLEQGAAGVKKFQSTVNDTKAINVAKARMNNAAGSVEQFKGAIETLQISALLPTMPLIKKLAEKGADLAQSLTKWLDSDQAKRWGDTIQRVFGKVEGVFKRVGGAASTFIGGTLKILSGDTLGGGVDFLKLFGFDTSVKLMQFWATFRDGSIRIYEAVKGVVVDALQVIKDNMYRLSPVIDLAKDAWDTLATAFETAAPIVKKIFEDVFPIVADLVGKVSGAIDWLVNNIVKPLIPIMGDVIESTWGEHIKPALDSMEAAFNGIGTAIEWVVGKFQWFKTEWDKISGPVGDAANKLGLSGVSSGDVGWSFMKGLASGPGAAIGSLASSLIPGHAGGLSNVPYDGYTARLHHGEQILTKNEAEDYRNGGATPITFGDIHINGASGNVKEMADEFMREIAQRLNAAGGMITAG